MAAEKVAEPTTIGRHQDCVVNSAIQPTTKPAAANTQAPLAMILALSFPKSLVNAQELSGQTIPG